MRKSESAMEMLFPEEEMRPRRPVRRPKVGFARAKRDIEVEAGTVLIDAIRMAGLDVPQQCGGVAICGWCKVRVLEGMERLSPAESEEERLAEWEKLRDDERASCRAEVFGDVVIDL